MHSIPKNLKKLNKSDSIGMNVLDEFITSTLAIVTTTKLQTELSSAKRDN